MTTGIQHVTNGTCFEYIVTLPDGRRLMICNAGISERKYACGFVTDYDLAFLRSYAVDRLEPLLNYGISEDHIQQIIDLQYTDGRDIAAYFEDNVPI